MAQKILHLPLASHTAEKTYSMRGEGVQQEYIESRTASKWVGFFLPHLRPGMSLLDCGCGVGSITLDLAERVAPGKVIGVDEGQLELARSLASARGITNAQFEPANIHALRFSDASFDAVLSHTLLMHLDSPLRALQEMRRILKPGGVIGVSDDDYSTFVHSPHSPALEKAVKIWPSIVKYNGGSPSYSRQLRSLLREAGFSQTEGHAVAADHHGTLQETQWIADILARLFGDPAISEIVVTQDWASLEEWQAIPAGIRLWGDHPDAFAAVMYCAAVGWVGTAT